MSEIVTSGLALLQILKSSKEITDEKLMLLPDVFAPTVIIEAAKLVDQKKIQSMRSTSGRHVFKVSIIIYTLYFYILTLVILRRLFNHDHY